jgi:hypothetical protein
LEHSCKIYERNREKQIKRKIRRKKEIENWTLGAFPAHGQNEPTAQQTPRPEPVPSLLSLSR